VAAFQRGVECAGGQRLVAARDQRAVFDLALVIRREPVEHVIGEP
jgi:hypothetical protein